jgi:hypothetical protein
MQQYKYVAEAEVQSPKKQSEGRGRDEDLKASRIPVTVNRSQRGGRWKTRSTTAGVVTPGFGR